MHIFLIAIAAVVFASGVLIKSMPNQEDRVKTEDVHVKTEVLNMVDESSPSASTTPMSSDDPTSTPASDANANTTVESGLVYPNSTNTGSNTYQTTDDPDMVTEWYKNQIRSQNYNVKNFVTTVVNGVVENELVGANSSGELRIIITKASDSDFTEIAIN